jgi:6-pyruvoyltetrahydropterin/6-carboxytetrahydropterin synthase
MAHYRVGVNRSLVARHYLVGGDFGAEGKLHSHDYRVEVIVEGNTLDEHGFLIDMKQLENELSRLVEYFENQTLNDLKEFEGVNPGCESFARVMAESLRAHVGAELVSALTVKIWENEGAWASCRLP